MQGVREYEELERQQKNVATWCSADADAAAVANGLLHNLGSPCGLWQEALQPRCNVSEPAAPVGCFGAVGMALPRLSGWTREPYHPTSLPPSPHPSPPRLPAWLICGPLILSFGLPQPLSPRRSACHQGPRQRLTPRFCSVKCTPADNLGKVAWEAYVTHFKMLAVAQSRARLRRHCS